MKLKVQVIIESDSGDTEVVREVARLERGPLRVEELGLTLADAKDLLQDVQQVMVTHQTLSMRLSTIIVQTVGSTKPARGSTRSCSGRCLASCG